MDNSFTYDWLAAFDGKQAWQVYDTHPIHVAFRKKPAPWMGVQVYDTLRVE